MPAEQTFSKHMIASFIKGIKSAFETNPGTSCDVVTSNASTISASTSSKPDCTHLYHTPPQRHGTGQAYPWTFAPRTQVRPVSATRLTSLPLASTTTRRTITGTGLKKCSPTSPFVSIPPHNPTLTPTNDPARNPPPRLRRRTHPLRHHRARNLGNTDRRRVRR